MIWTPFKIIPKKFLGIDIGTSSIKLVELSRWGERKKLENYAEIKAEVLFKKPFRTFEKSTLTVSTRDVARAILACLNEAKIKTKVACFSIPDFSSFFTWFDLPPMTKMELRQAVEYEARQHVPLPLFEVTLDWQVIEGRISDKEKTPLKILLVAVPNEIIHQYQEIARLANLELQTMEAETFGLSRALIKEDKEPQLLIDMGAQSTTVSVIDKKILKRSHSFDISGNELTEVLARSLGIDYQRAKSLKEEYGLLSSPKNIDKVLLPLIDLILTEIDKISQSFYQQASKEIQKIIIAGGLALLPGLKNYFSTKLKKPVEIAHPFVDILYPPILDETLKKMGPSYAIAVGTALRGFQ